MVNKLVDGQLVALTSAEVTARAAEEAANLTANKLPHLAAYRRSKEIGGIVVSGATIQTDAETRANILGAKDLGTSIDWKTPNGFVTLTTQEITAIATAIGQHVQKCFTAEKAVATAIASYDTLAEIEAAFDTEYAAL